MSKILLRILIIALLMFAGLDQRLHRTQAFSAKPGNPSSEAQKSSTAVEVTFDGLMVFVRVGSHYEVGILEPNTAIDHEFKITVGKDTLPHDRISKFMTVKNTWSLDVVSPSGTKPANIKVRQAKACNRLLDTADGQTDLEHVFDFCWMMDLENEFHGGSALALRPNKLKPIIMVNGGELYSKYKYDELDRERRPNDYINYGFVTETTGLRIDLRQGEHLVLSVAGQSIFSLPTQSGVTNAGIFNAPRTKYHSTKREGKDHSHFLYYYDVFSNVVDNERYDVRPTTPDGRRPLNRYVPDMKYHDKNYLDRTNRGDDELRMRTVDNMACGAVLLGQRTTSLTQPDVGPTSGRKLRPRATPSRR